MIESQAPTRIDLAGGTIDIWPLYLFHESAVTVNLAVNIYAKTKIKLRKDKKIIIESKDLKKIIKFASLDKVKHNHSLSLVTRLVSFFKPGSGIYIETDCESPAGAGLAGSSALNISLCAALNSLTGNNPLSPPLLRGNKYSKKELITIAKNIEAQVIRVPTGDQDYYPAMFGGLNIIELSAEGVKAERINIDYEKLEKRIILCYSGSSRNSGINNWEIFKRHIDGDKEIFKNLEAIRRTAIKMKSAVIPPFKRGGTGGVDFSMFSRLVGEEWENRKRLWKAVSTPEIERLINIAMKNGAISAKVCGAGGGGCIIFLSEPERQEKIKSAIRSAGGKILDYRIDKDGTKVKYSKEQRLNRTQMNADFHRF
jgi:D-glycero-alpha-D-manno-heptose-7-phosphate kinase